MIGTTPRARGAALVSLDSISSEMRQRRNRKTDRVVIWLQLAQWIALLVLVVACSPPHRSATIALGVVLGAIPVWLVTSRPKSPVARHLTAGIQAAWSALFVSISGGRF